MGRPREENYYNVLDLKPNKAIGIKLPLNNDNGGVFSLTYTTADQAITNLKNLLLTRPGERMMQPRFGTPIYDVLFDNNTEDIIQKLRTGIELAIDFWLPYIVISSINIDPKLDGELGTHGHGIVIKINFKVTEQGANETITLVVLQSGQAAIL